MIFPLVAHAAYTQSADTFYIYGNETFRNGPAYGSGVAPGSILPGATTGVASNLNISGNNGNFGYTFIASAVQDYLAFHGSALASGFRNGPGGTEYFQTFATGSVTETLTIPSAPVGAPYGSIGQLMLGWTVTGSVAQGTAGSAYMGITAHTSPFLPNTHSNTVTVTGYTYTPGDTLRMEYRVPFDYIGLGDTYDLRFPGRSHHQRSARTGLAGYVGDRRGGVAASTSGLKALGPAAP